MATPTLGTVADFIETAPDAMVVVDAQGTIRAANRRAVEMFHAEDLRGVPVDHLVPDRFAAGHPKLRTAFAADPTPRPMGAGRELRAKRLDGTEFPVEISLGVVSSAGEPLVSVAVRDITERREAEANAAVFGFIVAATREAIIAVDAAGAVTTWNRAAERLTGRPAADALGRPLWDCLVVADAGLRSTLSAGLTAHAVMDRVRTSVVRSSGRVTPVSISVAPIIDAGGAVRGASALVRDITEEVETQAVLDEVQARDAEMQRLAGIGHWVWDLASGEVQWSAQLHELAGISPLDFGGDLDAVLDIIDVDARDAVVEAMSSVADTAAPFGIECFLHRPDGTRRWVTLSGEAVRNETGAVVAVRGICQDQTDRHAAVEALREADRVKDEFLGVVSHELRTPLTAILGFGRILHDQLDGELGRYAEALVRNAAEMQGMVERILDYSRTQGGRLHLQIGDHAIGDLLEGLWPVVDPALGRHRRALEVDPGLVLHVDPEAFRHVMVNLLTNAAKFTPEEGTITITAQRSGPARVTVSVADEGPGIPETELEAVFDRFHQVKSNPIAARRGTGVGLAIVRSYVTAMEGTARAANRPDGGAVFSVELPAVDR